MVTKHNRRFPSRPTGYPKLERVHYGCQSIAQATPEPAYITCSVQLHNPSERQSAAILQVLKNNTLAGQWILRDIEQRKPEHRFAQFRKINSTHFDTDRIAAFIAKEYREKIRSRYTLNSYLFEGLCVTLAANISGYLQQMAEAQQKGWLKRYQECAEYVIKTGKHQGKILRTLGRKTLWGYAFLSPKREQCEEALRHLRVLLDDHSDDTERLTAEQYRMAFGPRRNRSLGSLRIETLRRIQALIERDLAHADEHAEHRKVAQDFLKFTPPGFPRVKSDGLSAGRKRELEKQHREAEQAFASLPVLENFDFPLNSNRIDEPEDELQERPPVEQEAYHIPLEQVDQVIMGLAEDERELFRELQRRAYAATKQPKYIPLRWKRTDGCIRHRECALVYDAKRRRYLFLGHILAQDSSHKRTLSVKDRLVDINNPDVYLKPGHQPSIAMLFELEFDTHQRQILDQARHDTPGWKSEGKSSGSFRSAKLCAHYSKERKKWWFEVQLSIGIKPTHYQEPKHIVGVHIDPFAGWFVSVLNLDGTPVRHFHLDERTIASWLQNHNVEQQAGINKTKRTTKEYHHRIANTLVAICHHYQAQLGIENISYRRHLFEAQAGINGEDGSRSIFALLNYKLARFNLPKTIDVRGVAPKRDCSRCGARNEARQLEEGYFHCSSCSHREGWHVNTAQEVARRVLWIYTKRQPQK